ncbi:hypothetical protein ABD87_00185 [Lysinibacillus sphaericus]|uniref:conjugal transfer protein n=1 Tax=Lysinibacillus sphaericus TaxID=1421 RepID=UPI0018CFDF8A|nr:conjugal transfer protein [Lysinibacillus sphaericus]MBG9728008.1 hypothetical protein [Lysinibacillus sphaericus]
MKKKKNASVGIKKWFTAFKKINNQEKEKALIKKELKANRPKGHLAKKAGVIVFWSLMSAILLLLVIGNINNNNSKASSDNSFESANVLQAVNDFGKQFLKVYLPLQFKEGQILSDTEQQRKELLSPYATQDIIGELSKIHQDTHNIGVGDIYLQGIEENGNTYLATYKVTMSFATNPLSEELLKATNEGAPGTDSKKEVAVVRNSSSKYITVKILHIKDENNFVVYELPSFEAGKHLEDNVKVDEKSGLTKLMGMNEEAKFKAFAQTFFDTYTKDSKEKLAYLLDKNFELNGLENGFILNEIKQIEVFKGAADNEYLIYVTALLAEGESNVKFPVTYTLAVIEKNDVLLAKGLNDKSYVQKALDYKLEIEMQEKEKK